MTQTIMTKSGKAAIRMTPMTWFMCMMMNGSKLYTVEYSFKACFVAFLAIQERPEVAP